MRNLDIGEVARRSGVIRRNAAVLRGKGPDYQPSGGMACGASSRPMCWSGSRSIALGRAAGFSLDEIARMFAPDGSRASIGRCSRRKPRSWTGRSAS